MKFKIIATVIIIVFLLVLTFLFNGPSTDDPNAPAQDSSQPAQQ